MSLLHSHVTDAYGSEAKSLLHPLQGDFALLAQEVTETLYKYILTQEKIAAIIHRLRPEIFKQLKQHVALYLTMLLSDALTHSAHIHEAQKVGRTHALGGIEIRWLVEAYSFYQEEIRKLLRERISDSEVRESIISVISQRFLQDIEGQASSYKQIDTEISTAFSRIDQVVMSTGNLTDLIRDVLEIIGMLPGSISVLFAREDELGVLQVEQSYGVAAEQFHRAMEASSAPKISIDPAIPAGQGPGGRAWRSGKIIVSDAWGLESDKAPWQKTGDVLGFRASAAIPILDESGRSVALLSLYSGWPGYFSTESIRGVLNHIQQVLSYGIQRRMNAPVVPLYEQQAYRGLLAEGRVVMHYQPIINLCDGSLAKIEGLARLRGDDGKLILPRRFLPTLGQGELLTLFELGMAKICSDLRTLRSQGLDTKVAINLPPEGMDDPRYEHTFFDCLGKYDLTPDYFQVELLETQDAGEKKGLHKAFIERLQAAGVQVVQDDLGSGHSSLLRLDQYPFDEVKIDQGLIRGALHNPKRAIDFILHLTRLAHAFDTPVTIEGLENAGMIEAATILGADRGQGYGIAGPMPLEGFIAWHRAYTYPIDPRKPKTAIGALAGFLLWDMQLAAISERPELATKFVAARTVVEEYIHANNLQTSFLDQLLARSLELAASSGSRSQTATMIRTQLIGELTDYWLREITRCA